ncbi:C40 family peptidase [Nonomuraea helvata]|uniref:C40 family peptidase n=1 Tax=Nonomuraea helvata TaxID=37484 RepID=A0ABV5S649_9ACTN
MSTSDYLARTRATALTVLTVAGVAAAHAPAARAAAMAQAQRAAKAVSIALEQVGDPYRRGAAGPGAFDCSGLMRYAWGRAGVRLPRVASDQYRHLRKVSWRDLAPGDLIFLFRLGHVAMYVGRGRMVHAPGRGKPVRVDHVAQGWIKAAYNGAARPGV